MLTAAVRDLHASHPAQFQTSVQTACPALWENNPHVSLLGDQNSDARVIDCGYPLIHQSNQLPYHFVHGFTRHLSEQLGVAIEPTAFKGDIHLSEQEISGTVFDDEAPLLRDAFPYPLGSRSGDSTEHNHASGSGFESSFNGTATPLWLVSAGGKQDFTIKWWQTKRYQQVVDHFRGRIRFVQIGSQGHFHPELNGVIDLRGKTTLRQLVRLVYHADGVLTPVSLLMHLSAAVPTREEVQSGTDKLQTCSSRPCVVLAGGREPVHWEAYPTHQFIHTVGLLPCCSHGGCWRSRTLPRGDGSEHDHPRRLCVDVVGKLPRCMDMITAEEVIRRIEMYLAARKDSNGKAVPSFFSGQKETRVPSTEKLPLRQDGLTLESAPKAMEEYMARIPEYPVSYEGRGIVICGGGIKYFTCAWVCINMLRKVGCELPIELWHIGAGECDAEMRALVEPLGVRCVDAAEVRHKHPARLLSGWPLKPYAMLHSRFREVLFLDADNMPVVNPERLFDTAQFQATGAIFWPDYGWLKPRPTAWQACGMMQRDERDFESGQIVMDKKRCWRELNLTVWMNGHSDFFYQHMHGDKDTFHLAWRKLGTEYAMPETPVKSLENRVMCQHDFEGHRVFQHRNGDKWRLFTTHRRVGGFRQEEQCTAYIEELRAKWIGRPKPDAAQLGVAAVEIANSVINARFDYHRIGYDRRSMVFKADGTIGEGAAGSELFWDVEERAGLIALVIASETGTTCELTLTSAGRWEGQWKIHQRMPIELTPTAKAPSALPIQKKPKRPRNIVFRAPINSFTGYGLHAAQIIFDLRKKGFSVRIRPTEVLEHFSPIDEETKAMLCHAIQADEWELMLHPPNIAPTPGKRTVFFTMWEASRLPSEWVRWLNAAECVVVPCNWNATCFSASGVDVPIEIVPLGINTEIFRYRPMDQHGPCIFGAAGKMRGGGERKGLNEVIDLFQKAFPKERDVELRIKGFPDCGIRATNDSRIKVVTNFLSEAEMAVWYASLTCFVSVSRSEGWGLMPHQAMAVGRPCIAAKFGGQAEYLHEELGYCADFKLEPARDNYTGGGVWAKPDDDHIIDLMRFVYRNRKDAAARGRKAAKSVAHLSWQRSSDALLRVLKNVGMVP